jgi:hypothetical protein
MPDPGDVVTIPNCVCCGSSSSSSSSSSNTTSRIPCLNCPNNINYQFTLNGVGGSTPGQNCSSLNRTWILTAPGFFTNYPCSWEVPIPTYSCQGAAGTFRWEFQLQSVSLGVFSWRLRIITGTIGEPTWIGTSNSCAGVTVMKAVSETCCRQINFPSADTYTFPTNIAVSAV